MRKLMLIVGLVGVSLSTSFAQRNAGYDRGRNDHHKSYHHKKGNWGYDANWNRVESGGKNAMVINSFQRQSRDRIAEGISRGLITGKEAKKLLTFAEKIEKKENRYLKNGRLTASEARDLKKDLDMLNRMITREMRDGDRLSNDRGRHTRRF